MGFVVSSILIVALPYLTVELEISLVRLCAIVTQGMEGRAANWIPVDLKRPKSRWVFS
jgi:hypothetical protein